MRTYPGALSNANYNLVGARTFNEALQLFYANKVDVVIIDIFLNGSPDGTFAETINVVPMHQSHLCFPAQMTDKYLKGQNSRVHFFLMKPFNELEILYAIEMAVEKFHNQNDAFFSDEQDTVISAEYMFIKKR
jgi:response regulator RpfG family c-di-GMP phosphodiesterase